MADVAYTIREARWSDCGAMSRKICDGRWLAYKTAGVTPKEQIRTLWGESSMRCSCLIDGRIVAMWGIIGSILSPRGKVWMIVSPEATRHPYALLREVRTQLASLLRQKRELSATIAEQDGTAQRFAKVLGFEEDGEPIQIGATGVRIIPMVLKG